MYNSSYLSMTHFDLIGVGIGWLVGYSIVAIVSLLNLMKI